MRKVTTFLIALLFMVCLSGSCVFAAPQEVGQDSECISLTGSNVNSNSPMGYYANPVYSYLVDLDSQFMRVQGYDDRGSFNVVYYDSDFKTKRVLEIEAELPIFGGFCASGGSYYVVSGKKNPGEDNQVEVFRITKYDSTWNRVGSCSYSNANTTIPFDGGSCRMTCAGNLLTVRSCHEMYKDEEDVNHQASVMMIVNTDDMSKVSSTFSVGSGTDGYVSHSFDQHVKTDGNYVVAADLGDAYPRSVCLNKFRSGLTRSQGTIDVFNIEGSIGENYTGVSVGGLEISDTTYLVVWNSVKQDENFRSHQTRNVYVGIVDKSTNQPTVKKLTDIDEGDGTTGTPQIVKTAADRFMVLWHRNGEVNYVMIDQNGDAVSEVYSIDGSLSDCAPIIAGGNVIWYTWKNGKETFYKIPVSNPAEAVKQDVMKGHQFELNSVEGGLADVTCANCSEQMSGRVPTSFTVYWNKPYYGNSYSYSSYIPRDLEAGSIVYYSITASYSANSDLTLDDFVVESNDPENCIVDPDNQSVRFLKGGNYTVTIYPKFNPTQKRNFKVYVPKPIESVILSYSVNGLHTTGHDVRLSASVDGGKGTLQYQFVIVSDEGGMKVIAGQDSYCYWTPSEFGDYTIHVEVTDPGDNNNKVSSEEIEYKVHEYQWLNTGDRAATVKDVCCNKIFYCKVPTSFDVWWKEVGTSISYSTIPSGLEAGSVVKYSISNIRYDIDYQYALDDFTAESSDPENCIVDTENQTVTFRKGGNYTITVYPVYKPDLKKEFNVYIPKDLEGAELTASATEMDQFGSKVKLSASADGGRGTLQYTFIQIDSEGGETVLQDKSSQAYCYWDPNEIGYFKVRVDVTDTGDNNNTVSSNVLTLHVHDYQWVSTENGLATMRCSLCESETTGRVPTSFQIGWNWTGSGGYATYWKPITRDVGSTAYFNIFGLSYSATADKTYKGFTVEVDDPVNCTISGDTITFHKTGTFKVTAFPTYNPELKKVTEFNIVKPVESVVLTTEESSPQEFGSTVRLNANVDGGKGALRYTYLQKDSEGSETEIEGYSSAAYCNWKAPAAGTYKLCVQVKDTGDSDRIISSEEIEFVISKAPYPPVLPKEEYTLAYDDAYLTNYILNDAKGWAFRDEDLGTELEPGQTTEFTAYYKGADAASYEQTEAVVKVTRTKCTHEPEEMTYYEEEPFTCTEDGHIACWVCESCGLIFSEKEAQNQIKESDIIIPAHHELTEHAEKDPECEAEGNVHFWQCDVCGECFSDAAAAPGDMLTEEDIIIPATGHRFDYSKGEVSLAATCTEGGKIVYYCEYDHSHTITVDTSPLGHDYDRKNGKVTTPATCTQPGEITYTCTHDPHHTITDVIPALGHNWDAGVITKPPTRTKAGIKTLSCLRCNETKTETLPARINQVAGDGTKVGQGASEEVANKAITTMKTDKDPAGSAYGLLKVKSTKQAKTTVTITWSKVKGAKKYVIYGNQCGKTNKMKKLATVTGSKYVAKKVINSKGKKTKIKKGKYYKFIIVALDGKRNVVSTSKVIHAATKGGKVGNDKSVTTKAKKNRVTVKVGKTFSLKAKAIPASKKLTVKRHRGIAYESSNKTIATVSAKGVIKGKKKGTCYVYAYAQNGVSKKIKVTVK